MFHKHLSRRRGQAMVEYMIVTGVVAAALFVPTALTDNMALADYLARAVRSFFRSYSFLISVS
ncbi:hypothetical protein [Massilia sp. S19_KUP03_FR1]|uniref:hypothetical protein n=1 Tax=Massilia sp. S19_KUP03_FR1 TaxID=3025503 RepID=UPI002FCD16D4